MALVTKMALAIACTLLVIGIYLYLRPVRYEYRGLKYVERRDGRTCSYFPHDNWEQLPLICDDTAAVRKRHGRQ